MTNPHKYNSGIVGNCAFIAHVDTKANVSWLCLPQYDSSFVFGSMLDKEKGGDFSIQPSDNNYSNKQYYIENTNVLCTEFHSAEGSFRVIDFAPRFKQYERYYKPLMLIRKIELISGSPLVKVKCTPTLNYGSSFATSHIGSNHLQYEGYPDQLRLTTNISLSFLKREESFLLNENKFLVLTYGIPLEADMVYTCEDFLHKTINYWQLWVKSSYFTSLYQEQLIRSALVLKIHQFEQTGAIIASSTTSLPESPDRGRNWDYRYCWLRDSFYTLSAFNRIGHFEELENYFHFIANLTFHHRKRLQPLYSIDGIAKLSEKELPLKGYLGNQPVRIGNAAFSQRQNDVYGQVLVSLLPLYTDKRFIDRERGESIKSIRNLLNMIEQTMEEDDAGLWEFRNSMRLHGYTFLFHWAGCSAAIKIFEQTQHENGLKEIALKLKYRAAAMLEKCYNPNLMVYAASAGGTDLDASLLQLITLGYLDPKSEKAKNHLTAMEQKLKLENGLFHRYIHADDFGKPESAFLICSFWYVEALTVMGRVDEAVETFEQLLQYTNHLGLLSEDICPADGSQWGNFPQTYSHVGLINAVYRIANHIDKPVFL